MLGLSEPVEVALGAASLVMFVGTIVAVPIFIVRVPDDYFKRSHRATTLPFRVLRIVIGATLIGLGIAMLVLPGQGLLTILVGLGILEFPLKDRAIARLLSIPKVHHAVDTLRHRAGKGSLELPSLPARPAAA